MRELLATTKALSDENRVRAVMALAGGELCVCQLIELLELAPSTVSKHMAVLHQAGIVETRKDGRWIYYSLPADPESAHIHKALTMLTETLDTDAKILADRERLACIRSTPRDELCKHYKTC